MDVSINQEDMIYRYMHITTRSDDTRIEESKKATARVIERRSTQNLTESEGGAVSSIHEYKRGLCACIGNLWFCSSAFLAAFNTCALNSFRNTQHHSSETLSAPKLFRLHFVMKWWPERQIFHITSIWGFWSLTGWPRATIL